MTEDNKDLEILRMIRICNVLIEALLELRELSESGSVEMSIIDEALKTATEKNLGKLRNEQKVC